MGGRRGMVPSVLVPTFVKDYVKVHFAHGIITKISKCRRGIIEVELNDEFDIRFKRDGTFIGFDD